MELNQRQSYQVELQCHRERQQGAICEWSQYKSAWRANKLVAKGQTGKALSHGIHVLLQTHQDKEGGFQQQVDLSIFLKKWKEPEIDG